MAKPEVARPKAKPLGKKRPEAADAMSQSQRFIETAKMLDADESGQSFEAAFDKLVKHRKIGPEDG